MNRNKIAYSSVSINALAKWIKENSKDKSKATKKRCYKDAKVLVKIEIKENKSALISAKILQKKCDRKRV